MNSKQPRLRIPPETLRLLEEIENLDWTAGMSPKELVDLINKVAASFRPDEIDDLSRAGKEFTLRTFRHYQTLGCIDPPVRSGKSVVYFLRQFLQALVLRRLLWEHVPSDRIFDLTSGLDCSGYRETLLKGVSLDDFVEKERLMPPRGDRSAARDTWERIHIAPGVELNIKSRYSGLSPELIESWIKHIRKVLSAR